MLKLHVKDSHYSPLWIVDKHFTIGSAAETQLQLVDSHIEALHAKIIHVDQRYHLKDNNSRAGTFINGQRITQKELIPGDTIRIGSTEIVVLEPRVSANQPESAPASWRLVSEGPWQTGKEFDIADVGSTFVGRSNSCQVMIPGTHLGRQHIDITVENHHLRIKDLGTASGTFLNDLPITNSTANNGDRLRVDIYCFRIIAAEREDVKVRLRKPLSALATPIPRTAVSEEPKRFKTRSTSPGNRIEAPSNPYRLHAWIALGIALTMGSAILTFLLW